MSLAPLQYITFGGAKSFEKYKKFEQLSRFEFGILNPRLSPLMCTCPTVRWPRWDSVQLARYLEKQYRPNKFSHNTFRQLQYFMLHKLDFAS